MSGRGGGTRDETLQAAVDQFRKLRQRLDASDIHNPRVLGLIKKAEKDLRHYLDQIMPTTKGYERKVLMELFNDLLKLSQAVSVLYEVGEGRSQRRSAAQGALGKLADDSQAYHDCRIEVLSKLHQTELKATDLIGKRPGRTASLSRRRQVTIELGDDADPRGRRSA